MSSHEILVSGDPKRGNAKYKKIHVHDLVKVRIERCDDCGAVLADGEEIVWPPEAAP